METLSAMEKVEVDNKDRPIEDIMIQSTTVFVDPFSDVDEELVKERKEESERLLSEKSSKKIKEKPKPELKVYRQGVGKYINPKRKYVFQLNH
jgi:peptidyl-prolyl cis-trans isomerase-like protein 2